MKKLNPTYILNKLATGDSDGEVILKHERNLRIFLNCNFSVFIIQCVCCGLEIAGYEWITIFR